MSSEFSEVASRYEDGYSVQPSPSVAWSLRPSCPRSFVTHDVGRTPRKLARIVSPAIGGAWIQAHEAIDVAKEFRRLARAIRDNYGPSSDLTDTLFSKEYMQVVGLGPRVVPLLLDDVRKTGRPWFWALEALVRTNPAKDVQHGDLAEVARRWLVWGVANNLL